MLNSLKIHSTVLPYYMDFIGQAYRSPLNLVIAIIRHNSNPNVQFIDYMVKNCHENKFGTLDILPRRMEAYYFIGSGLLVNKAFIFDSKREAEKIRNISFEVIFRQGPQFYYKNLEKPSNEYYTKTYLR